MPCTVRITRCGHAGCYLRVDFRLLQVCQNGGRLKFVDTGAGTARSVPAMPALVVAERSTGRPTAGARAVDRQLGSDVVRWCRLSRNNVLAVTFYCHRRKYFQFHARPGFFLPLTSTQPVLMACRGRAGQHETSSCAIAHCAVAA